MTDHTIVRNHWGQPWVTTDGQPLQYDGKKKSPTNAVGYTRVSTLAGILDDKSGLIDWSSANAAVGVVKDRSLFAQVASLVQKHGDPWSVPEAKRQLKPVVEAAQKRAGSDEASGLGTSFHEFTEVLDQGGSVEFAPAEMLPWLKAYQVATESLEVIDCEPFVVCDELKAAGSLDRLYRLPDGRVVVGDIKSGKSDNQYPLKVMTQVAVYANSVRYDQVSGERQPLHPDLDPSVGLLVHAPIRTGRPRCTVYELDLVAGFRLARLAVEVREARKVGKLEVLV
ncbi:hypothetical protein GS451_23995 [Rhodococcus hoagii]|nr:hypothetical protein [Prescottella equi]MBM4640672.1 hypothetical protein [Prescottella equi]NKV87460.1 hypothetical protein [Prescottella equi]NKV87973.1 hypothetical protein [Prescottella equi]